AAGGPHPAASGRRPRAYRAIGKLPQGREYLLYRRSHSAHRDRAAKDPQPRAQVTQRDQGSTRVSWAHAGDEVGELAACRAGKTLTEVQDASPPGTEKAESHQQPSIGHDAQHDDLAAAPRGDYDDPTQGQGAAARGRANHYAR